MRLISHRGNINGREPEKENTWEHIHNAINKGYDVEIDVWLIDNHLYLSHDKPDPDKLDTYDLFTAEAMHYEDQLWIHCKNIEALTFFSGLGYNHFWHQTDDYTLTGRGYIWAYPGSVPADTYDNKTIAVMPEDHYTTKGVRGLRYYGVCSDYIERYR